MSINPTSLAFSSVTAPKHHPPAPPFTPPGATDKPTPKDFTSALQASLARGAKSQ